jgi:deoxyribodipyrimidine photo-lyase
MVQVVWFKRDLRTVDHLPLLEASARGPVLPLLIVEPHYWQQPDVSRRQWLAIRLAIEELATRMNDLGAPLIIRAGNAVEVFRHLHSCVQISALYAHEETGNDFTFKRDIEVRAFCTEARIPFLESRQFGVFRGLKSRDNWARRHREHISQTVLPEPLKLQSIVGLASDRLPTAEDLHLAPDGCPVPQPGTRSDALARLGAFFSGQGAHYRRAMSTPLAGAEACSRLSVSLSTGAVSIREVIQRCYEERRQLSSLSPYARAVPLTAIDSLIARLHWHCHFIQKLESQPALEWHAQHELHEANRIRTDPEDPLLDAWATGQTGLPFLDACMRSLIATGWLNFRMRAMVQSVASYHFQLDWAATGTRLARLFTDYEPGIHWSQVQMQAGQTGINIPRIYNPVKQGLDQDPDGIFTRLWVPELARVPLAFLQEPWKMDAALQHQSDCVQGLDYPAPVVDYIESARLARARLTIIRKSAGYRTEAKRVFQKHGSRKRQSSRKHPRANAKSDDAKPAATAQLTLDF